MPTVTPRKLKSCLTSSPSDCSSPTNSIKSTSSKATTATPPTPYSTGGSSCYSTPTPTRRHKKSVRFKAEEDIAQVQHYASVKLESTSKSTSSSRSASSRSASSSNSTSASKSASSSNSTTSSRSTSSSKSSSSSRSRSSSSSSKVREEVVEVKKGKKRKEGSDDYHEYNQEYHESVSKIIESGPAGLGITVDGSYGPPTKAPPQAPLPRPTKRERTKYSQSPPTKSVESPPPPPPKSTEVKMTYSFDDSTSTSIYPDRSFGQAPPPPVPAQNTSFTEIGNYPPVPQIMSTGWSFTEQPEQTWWAYQEPEQPPMVAAASRPLRRKRSFEARKAQDTRSAPPAPEITDVDSMRSRRGSSKSTSSSSSSELPSGHAYKEAKVESSSRSSSSRRRREKEAYEEQYRMEVLKKQARQKTRDREVKKHTRTDKYGSFDHDAGAGYYSHKAPAYSFNADDGYDRYF